MGASEQKLSWGQFALFGVGCTIGTGFFLGSSIAIHKSGYFVLPIFLVAAFATLFVYEALAQMTAKQPEEGSFRTYAKQAFGRWAGFSIGWVYWSSEMLIMGSSLTAIGLFSQYWLPDVPLWLFAAVYSVLALFVVILGSKGINKAENLFAVVKMAAIVMFIVVAGYGVVSGLGNVHPVKESIAEWSDGGWLGAWKGLLYAFYAFSGIEVMGFMAMNLRNPEEAPKAGRIMLLFVTVLYVCSIGLALLFMTKKQWTPNESPLIIPLTAMELPLLVHLLNGVLIIAGFSILVASLYGVSSMLMTLSEDGDAPKWLAKKTKKRQLPLHALFVNSAGLCVSIVLALWMPKSIFEHITTAGGLVLLYTWMFVLITYLKLIKPKFGAQVKTWLAMFLIAAAVFGVLVEKSGRAGFWVSLLIVILVLLVTLMMNKVWARQEQA
ncbi:amino acid permease [Paenibacillus sinopodophylli]|uniref:amino acid permease n=1 Tax=Paenibacillus sinopodophylli TaxID=1837342 RepID=UPI001FE4FEBD|nr:amino acid permease [Paenibacillus sinopodophylli]